MKALFLAGGSGTRLWPLSTEERPKQFHALVSDKPLITETVERVLPLIEASDIWVVTKSRWVDQVAESCPAIPRNQIIGEPFPLGTNLAVGLGAVHILQRDPEAIVVLGWTDSYIRNASALLGALTHAAELAVHFDGVLIAVPPTFPATEYGYIQAGVPIAGHQGAFTISSFKEKPAHDGATDLLASGDHFWNPGLSAWKASKLLNLIEKHKPDHFVALQKAAATIGKPNEDVEVRAALKNLDRISIDHAIFEKATGLAVIPVDLDWSDIGSWPAIYALRSHPVGNVTNGPVVTVDTQRSLIYSQNRTVATLGVSDLIVVETEDAVLIAHRDQGDRLPELYKKVKNLTEKGPM